MPQAARRHDTKVADISATAETGTVIASDPEAADGSIVRPAIRDEIADAATEPAAGLPADTADDLAPARGFVTGIIVGAALWTLIIAVVLLLVR